MENKIKTMSDSIIVLPEINKRIVLTRKFIDDFYVKNNNELLGYAILIIGKENKEEAENIVTDAYIYLVSRKDFPHDNLIAYSKLWIKYKCYTALEDLNKKVRFTEKNVNRIEWIQANSLNESNIDLIAKEEIETDEIKQDIIDKKVFDAIEKYGKKSVENIKRIEKATAKNGKDGYKKIIRKLEIKKEWLKYKQKKEEIKQKHISKVVLKTGNFTEKIKNKKHVKIIYKKTALWVFIESISNNTIFGYIETMGKHYKAPISAAISQVVEV